MKRTISAVALAAALVLAAPVSAATFVDLKINPKAPIVDDDITVSFTVKKKLKPGFHYRGSVVTPSGDDCAGLVFKDATRNPAKGKRMSFRFSPYDDELNGGSEWCQGKASIMISVEADGSDDVDETGEAPVGDLIGIETVRFKAKP